MSNTNNRKNYILDFKTLINTNNNIKDKFNNIIVKFLHNKGPLSEINLHLISDRKTGGIYDKFFQFYKKDDVQIELYKKKIFKTLFLKNFSFLILSNQNEKMKNKFWYNLFIELKCNKQLKINYILKLDLFKIIEVSDSFETLIAFFIIFINFISTIYLNEFIILYIPNIENLMLFKNINKIMEKWLLNKTKLRNMFKAKYDSVANKFIFTEYTKADRKKNIVKYTKNFEFVFYQILFILNNICNSNINGNLKIIASFDAQNIEKRMPKFNIKKFNLFLNKRKKVPFVDINI